VTKLSPHFATEEFRCRDGHDVPASSIPALRELCVNMLEPLRAKYGRCHVNSGYRTRPYNASIGGARYSQHIYTDTPGSVAADVTFAKGGPAQWARSARWRFRFKPVWRKRARGGVGLYGSFVHLDSGARRDWSG
jgi:uncharacterized protein YcbK (DUF882 family)